MPAITRQALKPYKLTDRQEFTTIQPIFNGYNTNADNADKIIYFSDFTGGTSVSTGTVADSNTQPILARKYENNGSVFKFGSNERPASFSDTTNKRVTATGVNSGRTFTGITYSVDPTGFIMFVAKESVGNPRFTLRTTAGNERVFDFTATSFVAESNGYKRYIAPIAVGTYVGVVVSDTGTFNPALITETESTLSVAGNIELDSIHVGNNPGNFLGAGLNLVFNCIDTKTWTETLGTADQKCGNYVTGTTPTEKSLEIEFKYNDLDFNIEANSKGETLKRGAINKPVIINAENGGNNNLAVAAGVVLIAGLVSSRVATVSMNGTTLRRAENIAGVSETSYHYDTVIGFTFSTVYNGVIPTIIYMLASTGNYFDDKNLKTGFTGNLSITRVGADGTTINWDIPLVELISVTPEQGDAQVSHTIKIRTYPFKEGNTYRFYRVSKS